MEAVVFSFVVTGVAEVVVLQSLVKVSCLVVSVVFLSLLAVATLTGNLYVVVEGVEVVMLDVVFRPRQFLQ